MFISKSKHSCNSVKPTFDSSERFFLVFISAIFLNFCYYFAVLLNGLTNIIISSIYVTKLPILLLKNLIGEAIFSSLWLCLLKVLFYILLCLIFYCMKMEQSQVATQIDLKLKFRPFCKPGNAHAYLPYTSFHARHTFRGWILADS